MSPSQNRALLAEARRRFVGGVNSPVRAFKGVGGDPVFFREAKGPFLFDVDGRRYVDWVLSWGPHLLGHRHPKIERAVVQAAKKGLSFGAPHEGELRLARALQERLPWIEKVRFLSSGTEAVMAALRLARGATGRDFIVKCAGAYHGHHDSLLVKAGSGVATLGLPNSPGVPKALAALTLTCEINDLAGMKALFRRHGKKVACVIVEPCAGNMGVVPPAPGWLEGLRGLTSKHGALLVYDEVMTGFRVHPGGAVAAYGVTPDLVTLGKVVGGGMPAAALVGPAKLMDLLAPAGSIYQAGTLAGNPVAMAAGAALLENLTDAAWSRAEAAAAAFAEGLRSSAKRKGVDLVVQRQGTMLTPFFTSAPVTSARDLKRVDAKKYARFFHGLLENGVYAPPSSFEAWFSSSAHNAKAVAATLHAAEKAL